MPRPPKFYGRKMIQKERRLRRILVGRKEYQGLKAESIDKSLDDLFKKVKI